MNLLHKLSLLLFFLLSLEGYGQSVTMDKSFAQKGKFYFCNGRYNDVKDVAIAVDESVYVLVESSRQDSIRDIDIVVIKLSPKGIPDSKFGKEGKVQFDFHEIDISRAGEFKLLEDGKILIAGDGTQYFFPAYSTTCLARLLPNGKADTTFGKGGTLKVRFDKISYLTSLHSTNDNSVFIAGSYVQPAGNHEDIFPVVGKVKKNGHLDSSFGTSGRIWVDFNFQLFAFASNKHTAGGEITDILVQEDGKIIICGGFIFAYTYEGFIARILPDGKLDKSFNNKGYIRYDFTPGRFNIVKKMLLYDANTLIFGASSQTDFDSDFYYGALNLKDFSLTVTNIDFKGQHDIFEDISVDNKEVILSGRSLLAENAPLRQQSNFVAIARISDVKDPRYRETFVFPLSEINQNGSTAHAVRKDKIVIGGFQHTSRQSVRDVVVSRFIKKKLVSKKD